MSFFYLQMYITFHFTLNVAPARFHNQRFEDKGMFKGRAPHSRFRGRHLDNPDWRAGWPGYAGQTRSDVRSPRQVGRAVNLHAVDAWYASTVAAFWVVIIMLSPLSDLLKQCSFQAEAPEAHTGSRGPASNVSWNTCHQGTFRAWTIE